MYNNTPGAPSSPTRGSVQTDTAKLMASDNDGGANSRPNLPENRFGLLGLLNVIKMTDPDLNILSLGVNLIGLGFNLNASEPLYPTFSSLLGDHPSQGAEPLYNLPSCYNFPSPTIPPLSKIGTFSDETLFYIFYAMPRDGLQEAAAQELFKRNWRYHKELKVWVTKEPGTEAISKTPTFERGVYLFFDPTTWTRLKKEWILQYDCLEDRMPATGRVVAGALAANLEQQQQQSQQRLPAFDRPNVDAPTSHKPE